MTTRPGPQIGEHTEGAGRINQTGSKAIMQFAALILLFASWSASAAVAAFSPPAGPPTGRRRRHHQHQLLSSSAPNSYSSASSSSTSEEAYVIPDDSVDDIPKGCPFSMAFPRYRIEMSPSRPGDERRKAKPKADGGGGIGGIGGLLGTLRSTLDKSTVESCYKSEATVRWIECHGDDASAVGVAAAAAFWRAASDVSRVSGGPVESSRLVLALEGCSAATARRLCDVCNWHAERIREDDAPTIAGAIVSAEVNEEMPVPVVVLTKVAESSSVGKVKTATRPEGEERDTEERTKSWVRRILVDKGICPFTKSDSRSGQGLGDLGVPVAKISYRYSDADKDDMLQLMADAWEAISDMVSAGPDGKGGVSSILLSAPAYDDDFSLWSGPVFAMLESTVTAAKAEPKIGVVCFHPAYATPDGTSWPGFGHMHSAPRLRRWLEEHDPALSEALDEDDVAAGGAWQRRTPHACINVLRAEQLEVAEGRRATGILYTENIRKLVGKEEGLGSERLEQDLIKERRLHA